MINEDYIKHLDFDSDTFEQMKTDMNFVLQRLIGTMMEKGSTEGSMSIKVDVLMVKEYIPNYDPSIAGESREVNKPQFKHSVTSAVKISDKKSGNLNNEMEVTMDDNTGEYVLCPIANTTQRSIFDSDFQKNVENAEKEDEDNIIDVEARPLLPGPQEEEDVQTDNEKTKEENGSQEEMQKIGEDEELDDITDELFNDSDNEDDYRYDEPEGDEE